MQAEVKALDPLAEAFARGAEAKEDLLRRACGAWTAEEVAAHLHISRQAVNKRRKAGALLAVEAGTNYLYPRCQFTEAGVLEHLPEVLRAMDTESGWMKLQILFTHTLRTAPERAGEPPETILEALQRGRVEDALHAARAWARRGRLECSGIYHRGRHHNREYAVAVFDRAREALRILDSSPLGDDGNFPAEMARSGPVPHA